THTHTQLSGNSKPEPARLRTEPLHQRLVQSAAILATPSGGSLGQTRSVIRLLPYNVSDFTVGRYIDTDRHTHTPTQTTNNTPPPNTHTTHTHPHTHTHTHTHTLTHTHTQTQTDAA